MGLKSKIFSGTIWTTAAFAAQGLIQLLRLSILTRFLEKSDFGLVAIVVLVLGFTQIFADLGVSVSLFSRTKITKKEYSSLYWVSVILGVLLYVVLVIMAPVIADFYNYDELMSLIPILGLDLIFSTLGRQFRVFREKALDFKTLAIIDIAAAFSSLLLALTLAINGFGIYSLVFSTLFSSFLATTLLLINGLRTHPLLFYINLKEGRSFYKIGLYQTGSQILDFLTANLDILIIGKIMPASDLGVYNLVKQLVQKGYTMINPIVSKVAIPVLASLQEQGQELKKRYLQMLEILAFTNCAIYGLLALLAKEVLTIFYGVEYQDATLIFQLLCIWGVLAGISNGVNTLVIILGRTDLGFFRTIIRIALNTILMIFGATYGFIGIVIAQVLLTVVFLNLDWILMINRAMKTISFYDYIGVITPKLIVVLLIFSVLFYIKNHEIGLVENIFVSSFVYSLLFLGVYFFLQRDIIKRFISNFSR